MSAQDTFSGTMAVASRHQFDQAALAEYLHPLLPGGCTQLEVSQFKGGQSNPTFKLTTPHGHFVMRAKPGPAAKLLPSAHAIDREFKVMQALGQTQVPVPKVHTLCEDESIIGRAFFVMECVEGRVLWEQSMPDANEIERSAVYDEMNRVLALLHTIDYKAIGLADYGKPGNYFARQINRWSKQYQASETEHIDAMNRLIEWLPSHIPEGDETSIVHGDYRLDNLILHPTEPRIMAILDWELSTLGHPLADFSYHAMTYLVKPGTFRGIAGLDHQSMGIPTQAEYIRSYCERTGRTEINHWDFYCAYNLFRMCGILQGIAKRVVEGTAASEQAKAAGSRARGFAELGWQIVQKM